MQIDGWIIPANSVSQKFPLTPSSLDLFFGETRKKKGLEKASGEKHVISSHPQL